jgi:hypothetical protein
LIVLLGEKYRSLLKNDYINHIKDAGFTYRILDEDKEISRTQYGGINLESLKLELYIN